ncbi:MAG: hypothetical protein KKB59_20220 [Spirochaetes bacterium]|nr:hypothetical protein [Spirochaetota bacterium]
MNDLLPISLSAAVPLNIMEYRQKPIEELDDMMRDLPNTAQLIAEKGDILQFGGGKKGEVAKIFNKLASAIALAAVMVPGGITLFGEHWEAPHPSIKQAKSKSLDFSFLDGLL